MKNTPALILTFVLCSITTSHAYEFSFYNNSENPIAIAIQYTGNDNIKEPLYEQLVKPQSMVTFSPGKNSIPEIKWGFCLDQLYYVENPTQEQKNKNFEKAPWRKIAVTWVQEESITKPYLTKATKGKPAQAASGKLIKEKKISKGGPAEKSLCRDRHFDIIRDAQGRIAITSSLAE